MDISTIRKEMSKLGTLKDCSIYNFNSLEIVIDDVKHSANLKKDINNIIYSLIAPYYKKTNNYNYTRKRIKLSFCN